MRPQSRPGRTTRSKSIKSESSGKTEASSNATTENLPSESAGMNFIRERLGITDKIRTNVNGTMDLSGGGVLKGLKMSEFI